MILSHEDRTIAFYQPLIQSSWLFKIVLGYISNNFVFMFHFHRSIC